jgi:5-oxoprolinase (ATP-hydrolysing) subunit A
MKLIDLNCDMGERAELAAGGVEDALLECVTSANVACGAHAGDAAAMERTIRAAVARGVHIGAHPGYPDRENFGRIELAMSADEIARSVHGQLVELARVAAACGAVVRHVKPHGALYNRAVRDRDTAQAIATGAARWSRDVTMIGLAGSAMIGVFEEAGFRTAGEAFADRRYERDGSLRSRQLPNALITDPAEAARQAVRMVEHGVAIASDGTPVEIRAATLCLHGDTPGAVAIARAVAAALRAAGVSIQPLTTG